ncbi:12246_t:CDS:2 [Rhizophagus irregularis]|nr:12246_t:CDS:2 [Rhizophagus irregularis]
MQWTVSTLRRAVIYLCLAISSLVIIMTIFLIMSFTYGYFHLSSTLFNYNTNITYVIVWNFTIPILQNLVQFFFIYKAIKPKTKHSNTLVTRGGGGGTLTTTSILTNLGIRSISGHIRQKSFESSMGLIAEENSDGSRRTIMTKRNHSSATEAAAKASWNKPDINDHLSADERKRLSDSMEKREWLTKRPVLPHLRRQTLSNYLIYKKNIVFS